jgi:hypothetical protein
MVQLVMGLLPPDLKVAPEAFQAVEAVVLLMAV